MFLRRVFDRLRGAWFGFTQGYARLTTCRLTGVLNRDTILEVGRQEVERAKRYGRWLGIAVIDLDGFKPINDNLGHDIGDAVLGEVGRVLRLCVRAEDFVGRTGGDEFLLVFPDTDPRGLHAAVKRAFSLIECELEVVGISYGVHSQRLARSSSETLEVLVRAADGKMFAQKKAKGAQR